MAKSAAERKREQREREAMTEAERMSRLLSRTINFPVFKGTDAALIRSMARAGIEEPEDLITRLIHNADRLDDEAHARITALP